MMRILPAICALVLTATASDAGVKTKMGITFEGFPQESACGIEGAPMPVLHFERETGPRILVMGFASVGRVYCDMPDGRRVGFSVNKQLPSKARAVGFRIRVNGRAIMTANIDGELFTKQLSGVITPW